MDITPLVGSQTQIIQSYGDHGFVVSGAKYQSSIIVMPDKTLEWPMIDTAAITINDLKWQHFAPLSNDDIDILLLGTGDHFAFASPHLRQELSAQNISIDTMDNGAACRTYNVLVAEGRRVAAALMIKNSK